ncbi:MAG: ABC transporter permease [Coprococcus sp.]
MQVFKTFFMILNKYKGQVIMYVCIFCGLLTVFIKTNSKNNTTDYTKASCDFAVFDYDDSVMSQALVEYLEDGNKVITTVKDEKKSMQDALYNRDVDAIVRIPDGFEQKVISGEAEGIIDIITIPDMQASMLFEQELDSFLNMACTYVNAGYDINQAIDRTNEALNVTVDVSLPDGGEKNTYSNMYYFFNYLGWIIMAMIIAAITPVLVVFDKRELRNRIECSSYKFVNLNKELIFGMIITGIGISVVFTILSVILSHGDVISMKGVMWILNMLCYFSVAIAVAFLTSKITDKLHVISIISNVVSLGMSFLCGIFVPAEFLSEGVLKLAHFLPAYWYSQAVRNIDFRMSENMNSILIAMGIQILFAIAIIVIGMVVSKKKRQMA